MVKFRGIEINIISQFDICRLPEFACPPPSHSSGIFSTADKSSNNPIASCYVPIYSGSQIWFEYNITGPHPPGAAYFFKLLFDDNVITSWDCTAKHGYHGKMMYNLVCEGEDHFTGKMTTRRQALRFGSDVSDDVNQKENEGFVEIRIFRVNHRQKVKDLEKGLGEVAFDSKEERNLQLTNGGLLKPAFPQRRYKYHLLDPLDQPYATFRFYYRSYEYLEAQGIAGRRTVSSSTSTSTGPHSRFSDLSKTRSHEQSVAVADHSISSPIKPCIKLVSPEKDPALLSENNINMQNGMVKEHISATNDYIPPSDSEDSLSIITRDSVEDLPSTVPRSPKSPNKLQLNDLKEHPDNTPTSPIQSPRRRLKKKLTVNVNGVDFSLENKRRPLSPFDGGGVLRRICDPFPPSAPAAVTEFGPTIDQEVEEQMEKEKQAEQIMKMRTDKTTRTERGGYSLMRFLGRRVGSH